MLKLNQKNSNASTMNRAVERKASALLRQAELFMEVQGYQPERVQCTSETIDITASTPNAEETLVMHIVAESNLKSKGVGVEHVADAKLILAEPEVDRVIVFGKSFTQAARKTLQGEGISFFSTDQRFISTLNPWELYTRILDCVNELCQHQCGQIPRTEADCAGYTGDPTPCAACGGEGRVKGSRCLKCAGTGRRATQYICDVRLLSDNADFHVTHGWRTLLQHGLLALLPMLRASRQAADPGLTSSSPPESSSQASELPPRGSPS